MRILFLPGSYGSPAARFRIWQFADPLRQQGHAVDVRVIWPERNWSSKLQPRRLRAGHDRLASMARLLCALWLIRDAEHFDVIMLNRDLVPETNVKFLEPLLGRRNPRVVFDYDDAIYLGARAPKLASILPSFAWITAGNETLARFALPFNQRVTVIPTVVDTDRFKPIPCRFPGPVRLGWSGSHSTTVKHLPLVASILAELGKEVAFELLVISDFDPGELPGVRTRFIRWSEARECELHQLIDVGLMPLPDHPFERAKCGSKLLLYGAVGVPSVASPVGVNAQIICDGETGFIADSPEEWLEALVKLLKDDELRRSMGRAARRRVDAGYSVRAVMPALVRVFQHVMDLHPRRRPDLGLGRSVLRD